MPNDGCKEEPYGSLGKDAVIVLWSADSIALAVLGPWVVPRWLEGFDFGVIIPVWRLRGVAPGARMEDTLGGAGVGLHIAAEDIFEPVYALR